MLNVSLSLVSKKFDVEKIRRIRKQDSPLPLPSGSFGVFTRRGSTRRVGLFRIRSRRPEKRAGNLGTVSLSLSFSVRKKSQLESAPLRRRGEERRGDETLARGVSFRGQHGERLGIRHMVRNFIRRSRGRDRRPLVDL